MPFGVVSAGLVLPTSCDKTDSACTAAGFHENRNLNCSVRANCILKYKTPIKCPWFLQTVVFLFSCTELLHRAC